MFPCTTRHPQGRFLPRAYVCYRASAPIRIDGDLHKKAWLDGAGRWFFSLGFRCVRVET